MKKKTVIVICVAAAIIILSVIIGLCIKHSANGDVGENTDSANAADVSVSQSDREDSDDANGSASDTSDKDNDGSESASESESETIPRVTTEPDITIEPPLHTEVQSNPAPDGYYSDSLFIGDSRTVGLRDYSDIKAVFFASSGMSVYNVRKTNLNISGVGDTNLDGLLSQRSFKKIFVMLGINELGYPDMNKTVEKYKELVDMLREAQPDAYIIVQANLHVTAEISSTHAYFTNSNIDALNSKISEFADNKKVFFIDPNPLFDDESGNLSDAYTYGDDNYHPAGKYYKVWGDWIYSALNF